MLPCFLLLLYYLRFPKPTMRHPHLIASLTSSYLFVIHSMSGEENTSDSGSYSVEELMRLFTSQQKEIKSLQDAAAKKSEQDALQITEDRRENNMAQIKSLLRDTFGSKVPTLNFSDDDQDAENEEQEDPFTSSLAESLAAESSDGDADQVSEHIPEPICMVISQWFRNIHSGTQIQETLKLCKRPKNCDALKYVEINPEIMRSINKQDIIDDQRMKWLSQAAIKSAQPLAAAWSNMSKLEFVIQQRQPASEEVTDAMIPTGPGEPEFNLSQCIRDVKLSLKTMGMTSVQCIQKRRLDLRGKLQGAAKELADTNKKFDDTIFGPDLQKHFASILQANKITRKMATSSKPRGRSYRYNPFLGGRRDKHSYRQNYSQNYSRGSSSPSRGRRQSPSRDNRNNYSGYSQNNNYQQQQQRNPSTPRKGGGRGRSNPSTPRK